MTDRDDGDLPVIRKQTGAQIETVPNRQEFTNSLQDILNAHFEYTQAHQQKIWEFVRASKDWFVRAARVDEDSGVLSCTIANAAESSSGAIATVISFELNQSELHALDTDPNRIFAADICPDWVISYVLGRCDQLEQDAYLEYFSPEALVQLRYATDDNTSLNVLLSGAYAYWMGERGLFTQYDHFSKDWHDADHQFYLMIEQHDAALTILNPRAEPTSAEDVIASAQWQAIKDLVERTTNFYELNEALYREKLPELSDEDRTLITERIDTILNGRYPYEVVDQMFKLLHEFGAYSDILWDSSVLVALYERLTASYDDHSLRNDPRIIEARTAQLVLERAGTIYGELEHDRRTALGSAGLKATSE